jgi:hypothetical protein
LGIDKVRKLSPLRKVVSDERISGMQSSGGSSTNRRRFKRLVANVESALVEKTSSSATQQPATLSLGNAGKTKLQDFWTSTPLWSGITMLLAVIFSHVSVLLVYALAWILIFVEFVRVDFFTARAVKIWSRLLFGICLMGVLCGIWRVTPSSPKPPILDQRADTLLQGISTKMSLLSPSQVTNIFENTSARSTLAKVNFGFADEKGDMENVLSTPTPNLILGPGRLIGPNLPPLPMPSKVVAFHLLGRVTGDVAAKNLHVFVKICGGCDYVSLPPDFLRPVLWPSLKTDADKVFGDVPAGPQLVIGEFQIAFPLHGDLAEVSVAYTCDNCLPATSKYAKNLYIKLISKPQ